MKLIYVAGPYSGKGYSEIHDNIKRAEALSLKLWRLGWSVITPHLNTYHMEQYEDIAYETWLTGDLEQVRRCDAIIVLKNYEHSKGTMGEIEFCKAMSIPIFYESEGVPGPRDLEEKWIVRRSQVLSSAQVG